jgi:surface antigen
MKTLMRHTALIFIMLGLLFPPPLKAIAESRVYSCQCTDYVYSQRPDIPIGMGHAKDWLYSARVYRLPYDQVPQVGDVAVFLHGEFGFNTEFGHVAMVTEVNESRTTFSIAGWDGLKNDCRLQVFHNFPVTNNTYFIHQTIKSDSSTVPYTEWPHPFQGLIDLALLEF